MNCEFGRRRFLAGAIAASWAACQPAAISGQPSPKVGKTLDIHIKVAS